MFDRLIEVLLTSLRLFQFWYVLADYEAGVVLRFGRFHRLAIPGAHLRWPLGVEEILYTNVVPETMNIGPQSLTTAKVGEETAESIVVTTVVTFRVFDPKAFLLEIEGGNDAIADSSYGVVSEMVMQQPWSALVDPKFDLANELTKLMRRRTKPWGVEILRVQIQDLAKHRAIRLLLPVDNKFAKVRET